MWGSRVGPKAEGGGKWGQTRSRGCGGDRVESKQEEGAGSDPKQGPGLDPKQGGGGGAGLGLN